MVGFAPPNKVLSPQNRNMKHYESLDIFSNFQYQAPRHKRKAPLVKTSWRRFCVGYRVVARYLVSLLVISSPSDVHL